jgi:hypothetical protein
VLIYGKVKSHSPDFTIFLSNNKRIFTQRQYCIYNSITFSILNCQPTPPPSPQAQDYRGLYNQDAIPHWEGGDKGLCCLFALPLYIPKLSFFTQIFISNLLAHLQAPTLLPDRPFLPSPASPLQSGHISHLSHQDSLNARPIRPHHHTRLRISKH